MANQSRIKEITGGDKVPWPDRLRAAIYVTKARGDWR